VYAKVDTQEMELHVPMQIHAHQIHVKTVALVQMIWAAVTHFHVIVPELAIMVQHVKLKLMNVYRAHA